MAEPTSTTMAAGATAVTLLMSADLIPASYAIIVFGALVGVMHSVAKVETPTRWSAAWYVMKWVLTAALLTGFVSALLESYIGLPAHRWPGVVAFGITFLADRWAQWLPLVVGRRLGLPEDKQP